LSRCAPHLCAIAIRYREFERRQCDQLARHEEIEVDPREQEQLLASRKFGLDPGRRGSS